MMLLKLRFAALDAFLRFPPSSHSLDHFGEYAFKNSLWMWDDGVILKKASNAGKCSASTTVYINDQETMFLGK